MTAALGSRQFPFPCVGSEDDIALFCCCFAVLRVFRVRVFDRCFWSVWAGRRIFFHHGAETHVPQAPLLCHQVEPDASRQNSWWEMASSFPFLFPLLRNGLQKEEAGKREVERKLDQRDGTFVFFKVSQHKHGEGKEWPNLWTEATRDRKASLPSLSSRLFISGLNKGDRKLWKICCDISYCCRGLRRCIVFFHPLPRRLGFYRELVTTSVCCRNAEVKDRDISLIRRFVADWGWMMQVGNLCSRQPKSGQRAPSAPLQGSGLLGYVGCFFAGTFDNFALHLHCLGECISLQHFLKNGVRVVCWCLGFLVSSPPFTFSSFIKGWSLLLCAIYL